ncbi:CoxG family protein [Ramlibacter sp. AN1133]|uniref:CoxG family protein n=1 Tax=Ramlibacter sp. AN1133 TaxID=3133429 RepID=UPI0030C3954E
MELTGEVAIPASRERVWAALNDPAVLQACIPGCEEVVEESATVRKARVMVKVGPVRARFSGRMTLSEVEAPERCVMGFEGSGGAAGVASGSSQVELREQDGDTHLTYTVKASVGGRLGQVGGRMIDASAKQLADQFFEALRVRLAPPAAVPEGLPAPEVVPAAAPAGVAATAPPVAAAAPPLPVAVASAPGLTTEATRVLWFLLGAASTGFGVWLAKVLG